MGSRLLESSFFELSIDGRLWYCFQNLFELIEAGQVITTDDVQQHQPKFINLVGRCLQEFNHGLLVFFIQLLRGEKVEPYLRKAVELSFSSLCNEILDSHQMPIQLLVELVQLSCLVHVLLQVGLLGLQPGDLSFEIKLAAEHVLAIHPHLILYIKLSNFLSELHLVVA